MDSSNTTVSQKSEHHWILPLVIISTLLIVGVGFGGYYLGTQQQRPIQQTPISPTIVQGQSCTTEAKLCPDGSAVGRSGPNCEFDPCPEVKTTPSHASDECITGGCSGELCVENTLTPQTDGLATICIYKEEYKCLKNSRCEKQTDGKCGWTKTTEYDQCTASIVQDPS